jgi:hypothetical protein
VEHASGSRLGWLVTSDGKTTARSERMMWGSFGRIQREDELASGVSNFLQVCEVASMELKEDDVGIVRQMEAIGLWFDVSSDDTAMHFAQLSKAFREHLAEISGGPLSTPRLFYGVFGAL